MKEIQKLNYQTYLTGIASPDDELPLIVPLHFLGSNPDQTFKIFFQDFDHPARIIAPFGQYKIEGKYSWYPETIYGEVEEKQGKFVGELVVKLLENVGIWKQEFPTSGKPIFLGLSQGGDICFSLAAQYGDEFRLCMPIAGRLLIDEVYSIIDPGLIRIHHGMEDPIVPVAGMRKAANQLKSAGLKVEAHEYEGAGHEVPQEMLDAIGNEILSVILDEA